MGRAVTRATLTVCSCLTGTLDLLRDPRAKCWVLGEMLLSALPALLCTAHDGDSVLSGRLADQAALHGVLGQIESLGLELLTVGRIAGRSPDSGEDASPARGRCCRRQDAQHQR